MSADEPQMIDHAASPGLDDDEASLSAWTSFLRDYAKGVGPQNPTRPPLSTAQLSRLNLPANHSTHSSHSVDTPLYSSTSVTPELARTIRDFYCDHGYLPPPRVPWEESRERCILEYDLYSARQVDNIQSMTDLTAAYFPDALITFSLFRDRIQTHFALSGPKQLIDRFQLHVGLRIPAEDSLCGHAVLQDRQMLFVPDLEADWRYKRNPFGLAGFKSFVGVPVALELDPLPQVEPDSGHVYPANGRIAIGTLNICFTQGKVPRLSPSQRLMVNRLASMLETQLRATWEGDRRRRDGRAREELSAYIEEAMIGNAARGGKGSDSGAPGPHMRGNRTASRDEVHTMDLVQSLASKVHRIITEADTVNIFDLRGFSSLSQDAQYIDSQTYPLRSLARSPSGPRNHITLVPAAVPSVLASDVLVYDTACRSGLEPLLPADTNKHLAIPLSDGNRPLYLLLITSTSQVYHFTVSDVRFIQNLGSILVAKSIQARVMREDAAKTSFLSAISHELRTPMHAVTTSHSLMREAISNGTGDLDALLSLSESSSRTLTNILNDVLDFGKGTAGDIPEGRTELVSDLVSTVVHTVNVAQAQYVRESSDVIIAVEYDERDWACHLDEARFQRVLINGLTNAMKFCQSGSITVRLKSLSAAFVVEIIDTGVGFDQDEMPFVFEAFKKLDINSPGAGLGLHITKAMVEKAGGSLALRSQKGKGTTFEAMLPVVWAEPAVPTRTTTPTMSRKQIRPADHSHAGRFPSIQCDRSLSSDMDSPLSNPSPIASLSTTSSASSVSRSPSTPKHSEGESHRSEVLRVLIVDDNHICLTLLSMSLRKGPVKVELREAHSGSQALDIFREVHPHLVFTDVCMPGLDGIAAAEKMREHELRESLPRSAIYAVTALGETDTRSKSKGMNGSADLDGWLVKGQDLASVARDIARRLSDIRDRQTLSRSTSSRMMPTQTS